MLSLQKILGQDKRFFDLLEESAAQGQAGVTALRAVLQSKSTNPSLADFTSMRRKDKEATNAINDMLCKTFVTALEREDIEALVTVLYKIPKIIEKFAERYAICAAKVQDVDFARHLELMERATALVRQMIYGLRNSDLQGLVKMNTELQAVENEGDQLISELTAQLYLSNSDPLKAIILKDLFELLEKVIDRCRSAGNVMARVALKHA
jgi:uncharacterized protein Yka (UPF0111/DUF47 family)